MNIYEYTDYRKFLLKFIHQSPKKGRGIRSKMAEVMNCKTSYVTQVLVGKAGLSVEQAYELREIFNFNEEEAQYFLLLVLYARAGTDALKKTLKKQISSTQ